MPESTLRRWWRNFQWWGETPIATARRFDYQHMGDAASREEYPGGDRQDATGVLSGRDADRVGETLRPEIHLSTLHRVLTSPQSEGGLDFSLQVLTVMAVQANEHERMVYRTCLRQVDDPAQFVLVDECSVGRNASRRQRGYGRRGRPVSGFEVFVGEDNPHLGPKHYRTLIGVVHKCVDIKGFVRATCEFVHSK